MFRIVLEFVRDGDDPIILGCVDDVRQIRKVVGWIEGGIAAEATVCDYLGDRLGANLKQLELESLHRKLLMLDGVAAA